MTTWITRDGVRIDGPHETENAAFGRLLHIQPMSCSWAMEFEGYAIVDDEDPEPEVAVIDMETDVKVGEQFPVVARFDTEGEAITWLGYQDQEKVKRGGYGVDVPEPCCYPFMQTRGQHHAVDCEEYR